MKKIFTLLAATLLTVATFAADHRPSVTLKSARRYEIVIDGRSYFSNGFMDLSNLRRGQHSIKVFEMNRGFMFMRVKRLVDATYFELRNRDIDINIDFRGQIHIQEERFGRDRWDDRGYDRDYHRGYDRDRDDRGDWGNH